MKKEKKSDSISTFLGLGVTIEGRIDFKDTIRLDGCFKGSIDGAEGTLIVGEKAVVEADIHVSSAIVMGTVKGTIAARERVEIFPPAKITGDIQAPVVAIEKGVVFNGTCNMSDAEKAVGEAGDPLKIVKK